MLDQLLAGADGNRMASPSGAGVLRCATDVALIDDEVDALAGR